MKNSQMKLFLIFILTAAPCLASEMKEAADSGLVTAATKAQATPDLMNIAHTLLAIAQTPPLDTSIPSSPMPLRKSRHKPMLATTFRPITPLSNPAETITPTFKPDFLPAVAPVIPKKIKPIKIKKKPKDKIISDDPQKSSTTPKPNNIIRNQDGRLVLLPKIDWSKWPSSITCENPYEALRLLAHEDKNGFHHCLLCVDDKKGHQKKGTGNLDHVQEHILGQHIDEEDRKIFAQGTTYTNNKSLLGRYIKKNYLIHALGSIKRKYYPYDQIAADLKAEKDMSPSPSISFFVPHGDMASSYFNRFESPSIPDVILASPNFTEISASPTSDESELSSPRTSKRKSPIDQELMAKRQELESLSVITPPFMIKELSGSPIAPPTL